MDKRGYKHGLRYTPEYRAWIQMRGRCFNQNSKDYGRYGGRGISICPEWDSPVRFISDMGLKPSPRHELDRIDNNAGYTPSNCRWTDKTTQMRNTCISKIWFVYGIRYGSLTEAARALSTTPSRIKAWCEGRSDGGYSYPPKHNCWSEKVYE